MKKYIAIFILILLFVKANFAQTDLDASKFGSTVFDIVKVNDYERLTALFSTFEEYKELYQGLELMGESKKKSDEELKKELNEFRRKQLVEFKQGLSKIHESANGKGIILKNAKFLYTDFKFKGVTETKSGFARIEIVFEYLELKYYITLTDCIYTKTNGYRLGDHLRGVEELTN
jgi:hypothetical protein